MRKRFKYGLACVLLMTCMGLIYAWSVFVQPLEAEFGWTRAQTSLTFTICMIFFCVGNIAAGWLSEKRSVSFAIRCAAIFLLIGFVGASQTNSLIGLYILYGVFCGTGVGFGYNILFNVMSKWYWENAGLGAGILSMSFGAGGALLGSLAVSVMEQVSWRAVFLFCGIFFCALTIVCSKWIVLPESNEHSTAFASDKDFTTKQMIKTSSFWFYFIWNMCANGCGMVIIAHASPWASEFGASLAIAALAASLAALSRAVGGIISGYIYDKYGYKRCMATVSAQLLLGVLLAIVSGIIVNVPLLLVSIFIIGLGFGGSTANNIAIMNDFFGKKHFGTNFSVLNQCVIPGSFFGATCVGLVRTYTGSYLPSSFIPLAMALLGIFCFWRLRPPKLQ